MDSLLVAPGFLQDQVDFHSPRDNHFDISPNLGDAYDSFDFPPDNAHFPHTPSYNGSYQNSPYSNYSDLPPIDGDDAFGLFSDNPSGISITEEYDPTDYDVPSSSGLLTTLDDRYMLQSTHVSVSVTPPTYDQKSPSVLDHSSPGSSNGGEDDSRSRASSTSSYMRAASPRLEFAQNFEGLRFDSPGWVVGSLPSGDRPSPPANKPQSPPQLVIPDSTSSPSGVDSPPIINAPDGDGGLMTSGPQLHIVPATPVSGGGGGAQSVPFQQALVNMQPGGSQSAQQSDMGNWDHQSQQLAPPSQNPGLATSQFADHSYAYPGSNAEGTSGVSYGRVETSLHPGGENESQQQSQFLLPQGLQRSRSLSDTSLRPPVWDTMPMLNHQGTSAGVDGSRMTSHDGRRDPGTVNMNDVLPGPSSASLQFPPRSMRHPSSAGPHQSTFNNQPLQAPGLSQHFAFGPSSSGQSLNTSQLRHDFLTPDIGAVSLRRARSDSSRTHRQVRSEDLGYSPRNPNADAGSMLFPPPSSAQQEFIRAAANNRQYLHPSEPIASIARGHHRRASSGSGSRERPAGLGAGGWSSAASSARASPYPSPSASPRPGYNQLPGLPSSDTSLTGAMWRPGMQVEMGMGMPSQGQGQGQENVPMTVSKVNVTTPSTADASQKRRKQPANFACPVPGCGSTFTRHFNLKGHLRSHAEEKPYGCKWPGCGKGFARQHDCKRHEQLHLNIRPYPCEGCKKNFARMDALNRHLRSEGGAECRKIQEELTPNPGEMPDMSLSGASNLGMKPDPDGVWTGMGGLMM
ncbi:hypothetical protein B0H21DRAFT_515332 [Amylocystis lapponica]|nr:hypothetical protein B0H21DRAFT_515332 [Amylocystis lapponica]